ncbi:MAG: DUF1847 domain-containing protein [Oscillospiraceae bacterium]
MPNCAECQSKPCRSGELTGAPKNCPSLGVSPEQTLARYTEEEKRTTAMAARVEADGYCRNTRLEEIMDYADRCGYEKLGVAFCVGLSSEAATFCKVLRSNGFVVESVCCKNGCVSKEQIGLPREQWVRPERTVEPMCNPVGQAAALDGAGCQLNILLGLCVGHDTLFINHSKAPITVFAVKDRVLGHNPIAAVYSADGYMKRVYHFRKKKD